MKFTIIRVELKHIDLLVPLFDAYRVFYEQHSDLSLARLFLSERLTRNESIIFLAYREESPPMREVEESELPTGKGLGFVQLYPSFSSVSAKRMWILNDLFVDPEARRQGVAQGLMEAAREFSISTGAKGLFLETAHDNHGAQALYESLGYTRNTEYYYFLPTPPQVSAHEKIEESH